MKKSVFICLYLFCIISINAQELVTNRNGKEITVNSDATTTTKGNIKLAGDLGGTADAPTIPALTNKIDGSGTTNYIPKFSASKTLANSLLYEDPINSRIGIGSTEPISRFDIQYGGSLYSGYETDAHGLQILSGKTNSDYTLYMGTDKTNGLGYIQSVKWGVSASPLCLNARGGFVGIATNAPLSLFSNVGNATNIVSSNSAVQGSTGISWLTNTTGYNTSLFNSNNVVGSNGLQVKVANISNQTIAFEVGQNTSQTGTSNAYFNVLGNGNVGVGTNNPTSLFYVKGATGGITLERTAGTAPYDQAFLKMINKDAGAFQLRNISGTLDGFTITNGLASISYMTGLSTGYIGIGTTAPSAHLEVATTNSSSVLFRRATTASYAPVNLILQRTNAADPATTSAVPSGEFVGKILFSASNGTATYPLNGTDIVGYAAGNQSASNNGGGIMIRTVPLNSVAQSVERVRIENNGNVGIGDYGSVYSTATANTPGSKLEVDGAATNRTALNAVAAVSIDFTKSNLAYTSASAGAFTLTGLKDGGTYTLAVQGATAGTASFTGTNPAGTALSFKSINNAATTANKHTLYTFIVMGTTVYFYMATGF